MKKRSNASSASPKQPKEPTFFVDRQLGRYKFAEILRAPGLKVVIHDDHFAPYSLDTEWLAAAGKRNWIVITRDEYLADVREVFNRSLKSLFVVALGCSLAGAGTAQPTTGSPSVALSSPAFKAGEEMPDRFTCNGANVSPPLRISGTPASAKSLALIVEDPDAPGGLFTHWIVWNIAPTTTEIAEKNVPAGATQGINDFGQPSYGGPCPPSGTHRYFFRLIALDRTVDLKSGARRRELDKAIAGHVLARGELMARSSH